jgi:hypothetical protein
MSTKISDARAKWVESIKNTAIGRFVAIIDQEPERRSYRGLDGKHFISEGWKVWNEDYTVAYNELDKGDLEYLNEIDFWQQWDR